jgi:hypothetical protein
VDAPAEFTRKRFQHFLDQPDKVLSLHTAPSRALSSPNVGQASVTRPPWPVFPVAAD